MDHALWDELIYSISNLLLYLSGTCYGIFLNVVGIFVLDFFCEEFLFFIHLEFNSFCDYFVKVGTGFLVV